MGFPDTAGRAAAGLGIGLENARILGQPFLPLP